MYAFADATLSTVSPSHVFYIIKLIHNQRRVTTRHVHNIARTARALHAAGRKRCAVMSDCLLHAASSRTPLFSHMLLARDVSLLYARKSVDDNTWLDFVRRA